MHMEMIDDLGSKCCLFHHWNEADYFNNKLNYMTAKVKFSINNLKIYIVNELILKELVLKDLIYNSLKSFALFK